MQLIPQDRRAQIGITGYIRPRNNLNRSWRLQIQQISCNQHLKKTRAFITKVRPTKASALQLRSLNSLNKLRSTPRKTLGQMQRSYTRDYNLWALSMLHELKRGVGIQVKLYLQVVPGRVKGQGISKKNATEWEKVGGSNCSISVRCLSVYLQPKKSCSTLTGTSGRSWTTLVRLNKMNPFCPIILAVRESTVVAFDGPRILIESHTQSASGIGFTVCPQLVLIWLLPFLVIQLVPSWQSWQYAKGNWRYMF